MNNRFPLIYHTHHSHQSEDIPFWISLAREYGGPVLELGCGTGRVLIPLAKAGFTVFGLDNDIAMLRFLQNNLLSELEPHTHIFLADLSSFLLALEFPLILMPCNTLSTLSRQSRLDCFNCVYQHLTPGGVFAASLPNPVTLLELPEYGAPEVEEIFDDPDGGGSLLVSSEWKRESGSFVVRWHYDRLPEKGDPERLTVGVSHDLAQRQDYLLELELAGFMEVDSYGSFKPTRYHSNSSDLILIVRKKVPEIS